MFATALRPAMAGGMPPHRTLEQGLWCLRESGEFATTDPTLAQRVINHLKNMEIPHKVRRTRHWIRIIQVEG